MLQMSALWTTRLHRQNGFLFENASAASYAISGRLQGSRIVPAESTRWSNHVLLPASLSGSMEHGKRQWFYLVSGLHSPSQYHQPTCGIFKVSAWQAKTCALDTGHLSAAAYSGNLVATTNMVAVPLFETQGCARWYPALPCFPPVTQPWLQLQRRKQIYTELAIRFSRRKNSIASLMEKCRQHFLNVETCGRFVVIAFWTRVEMLSEVIICISWWNSCFSCFLTWNYEQKPGFLIEKLTMHLTCSRLETTGFSRNVLWVI